MWYMTLWDGSNAPLQWGVVIGASLVAAFFDLRVRRIPNPLTGTLVLSGLVWSIFVGGLPGLGDASCAMVLCSLPFVVLFLFAGGGAGDAKLMAGVGAWLGLVGGLAALAGVAIAGIVVGLIYAATKKKFVPVLMNIMEFILLFLSRAAKGFRGRGENRIVQDIIKQQEMIKMPYGLAILLGVCFAAAGVYLWRAQ
jgi:prepilin peptidase CpaA